jgi:hypothetical protein
MRTEQPLIRAVIRDKHQALTEGEQVRNSSVIEATFERRKLKFRERIQEKTRSVFEASKLQIRKCIQRQHTKSTHRHIQQVVHFLFLLRFFPKN